MAFVLNYIAQSLEDFVLLAHESPVRATLSLLVISTLAFSNVWAGWIARLQQSAPLKFASITALRDRIDVAYTGNRFFNIDRNRGDAGFSQNRKATYNTRKDNPKTSTGIQGVNHDVNRPLKSASTIQPSHYDLGNNNTQSERGRAGFPSTAGRVSNRPPRDQYTPIGFPIESYNILDHTNRDGNIVIGLPLGTHRDVSFYASTSPNGRSKSVLAHFWLLVRICIQTLAD